VISRCLLCVVQSSPATRVQGSPRCLQCAAGAAGHEAAAAWAPPLAQPGTESRWQRGDLQANKPQPPAAATDSAHRSHNTTPCLAVNTHGLSRCLVTKPASRQLNRKSDLLTCSKTSLVQEGTHLLTASQCHPCTAPVPQPC